MSATWPGARAMQTRGLQEYSTFPQVYSRVHFSGIYQGSSSVFSPNVIRANVSNVQYIRGYRISTSQPKPMRNAYIRVYTRTHRFRL